MTCGGGDSCCGVHHVCSRYQVPQDRGHGQWRKYNLGHSADCGRYTCGAAGVAHHVRHVDVRAVQLVFVGCSHLHYGIPEVADLVNLVLSLGVECHGVGGKTVADGVETVVVRGGPWYGKA